MLRKNLNNLICSHVETTLYVIVDGASNNDYVDFIRFNAEEYYSLYTGKDFEILEEVSPYLIPLRYNSSFVSYYINEIFDRNASILLVSNQPISDIVSHLQKYAKPKMEFTSNNGDVSTQSVFLAYYDPRVFPRYLRSVSSDYVKDFIWPFQAFYYEIPDGRMVALLPNEERNNVDQYEIDFRRNLDFSSFISNYSNSSFTYPNLYKPLIDIKTRGNMLSLYQQDIYRSICFKLEKKYSWLRSHKENNISVQYISKIAKSSKMNNVVALQYYIEYALRYGINFNSDPQYTSVTKILNKSVSDLEKIDVLHEGFKTYEAAFPHESELVNGLNNLLFLFEKGGKVAIDTLLQELSESKYLFLGNHSKGWLDSLTNSLSKIIKKNSGEHLLPLMTCTAFIFGHRFYEDLRCKCFISKIESLNDHDHDFAVKWIRILIEDIKEYG